MAFKTYQYLLGSVFFILIFSHLTHSSSTPQVYIVYLGSKVQDDPKLTTNHHLQLLSNVFSNEKDAKQSLLYNYKHSFSGFSAMLNSSQASILAKMKEVISVFKSKTVESHTTRSWDFLGLSATTTTFSNHNNPLHLAYGHDIVVGVIDSGIWPESASFEESRGMGPIPSSWRGRCVKGDKFNPRKHCNKKLIGARFYPNAYEAKYRPISGEHSRNKSFGEYRSPRDFGGHGTHVASTIVGSMVRDVSFLGGVGKGTARGGAPNARLAVYKACWWSFRAKSQRCVEADILKAFDDALRDGVHVISASIGSSPPLRELLKWSASIGSFHAQQLGVTTIFPSGNYGPLPTSVTNVMPWAICVAASTIDRTFPTNIVGQIANLSLVGQSFSFFGKPMIANLLLSDEYFDSGVCKVDYLIPNKTRVWKSTVLLLCLSWAQPIEVADALSAAIYIQASGLIFAEAVPKPEAQNIIPLIHIDFAQALKLRKYHLDHHSESINPLIRIEPTKTMITNSIAPKVSYFSSRGPSSIEPNILKPDISAPGINILAAWPADTPLTPEVIDSIVDQPTTFAKWNFQSGTSMSCPHVSAIVALLKSAHPDWSPSAIKSALITTASVKDNSMNHIVSDESNKLVDPFDIGAGHVNPVKAMDPGLVYDMKTTDYIAYLCNLGYTPQQIQNILLPCPSPTHLLTCSNKLTNSNSNLNYPSISVSDLTSAVTIKRTVTNVGSNKFAVYVCDVVQPNGVDVTVWPKVLVFSWFNKDITYYVTLKPNKESRDRFDFGEIIWRNIFGHHEVRSPLVVQVNTLASFVSHRHHRLISEA